MKNNRNNSTVAHIESSQQTTISRGVLTVFLNVTTLGSTNESMDKVINTIKSIKQLAESIDLCSYDDNIKDIICDTSRIKHVVHRLHMEAAKKDARITLVTAQEHSDNALLKTVYFK